MSDISETTKLRRQIALLVQRCELAESQQGHHWEAARGAMKQLDAAREREKDLQEELVELRRLLLDVGEHGVTPCALEDFRRAVGKPEWGNVSAEVRRSIAPTEGTP